MNFGEALEIMRLGCAMAREGWNGKEWVSMSPGSDALPAGNFWSGAARTYAISRGGNADVLPCLIMRNAAGKIVMGWLASQEDMLAEDWEQVPAL